MFEARVMADSVHNSSVQGGTYTSALSSLSKRSSFEAKMLPVALENDESLLLKAEAVAT